MLENHHIGQRANEAPLAHLFLEAQKKKHSIVAGQINVFAKIALQIGLFIATQPTNVAAVA